VRHGGDSGTAPNIAPDTIGIGRSPRDLLQAVLLESPSVGTVQGPFFTQRGPIVIQVVDYAQTDLDTGDEREAAAREAVGNLQYFPMERAYFDSLRTAAGVQIHDEAVAVIQRGFTVYWDSLRLESATDFQLLKAPHWMFTSAELGLPAFELLGATHSLNDFVDSLDDIDLDFWPTVGEIGRVRAQVEQRVLRLLLERQADPRARSTRGVPRRDLRAPNPRREERVNPSAARGRERAEQLRVHRPAQNASARRRARSGGRPSLAARQRYARGTAIRLHRTAPRVSKARRDRWR
jgi:hypothetical protein